MYQSIKYHRANHLLFRANLSPANSLSGETSRFSPSQSIVIVVSPLNSLMRDQIRRINQGNIKATVLNVQKNENSDEVQLDLVHSNSSLLRDGRYDLVFTHPEAVLSSKEGLELFQRTPCKR